jgi:aminoglycoside 3-N-acetyltransferase I
METGRAALAPPFFVSGVAVELAAAHLRSMSQTFEIVRLGGADAPRMTALNTLFAEVFEDPQSYAAAPPDEPYLARVLSRPQTIVLVAEADGAMVGGLVAYELEKLEQARSEIYLYDLAVREAFRRRGVATALIAKLQRIATVQGAWVVMVQGDYGDEPALALYRKLGVQEEVLHFDIPPGAR